MAGPAKYPLQTKFWKSFGRYGIFLGTVVGYDSDDGVYRCYYEGDGDEENLTEEEIESWLKRYPSVAKINQGVAKKKRTEYQPNKEQARKPTPEKKQSRKGPPKMVAAKSKHKAHEEKWKENLQKLKAFREEHGHTCVPFGWPQDPKLATWVNEQRRTYKQGTIKPHRLALLEQEGFEFVLMERCWDKNYQLLVDHQKQFEGLSNVTREGPHKKLYEWIRTQKKEHWKGRLPSDRKKLLEKLGLNLKKQLRTFEENFHLLLEFQKIHGHTNVPQQYQDQKLASFVHGKRDQCRTNQIPQAQRQELEKIGFQFRLLKKPRTFEENYELLLKFKEEFGHVNVPKNCQWDKCLWIWVQHVRSGNTKVSEIQKKKLDDIGFEWRLLRTWQESFDALLTYKKEHGHCSVPRSYKKDTALGFWVCRHKKPKRYNRLSPKQKDQLKAVGFHPNQDDTRPANALEPNPKASHASKSKKRKAATNTGDTQAIFQKSNQAIKSTGAAKQRARLKIENQVDQESSKYNSASDSYDSDESSSSDDPTVSTYDETALSMDEDAASVEIRIGNQQDHPEEVMSSQAEDRRSGSEVAPDQTDSSMPRAQSTGAARCHLNASQVVPDLARSATTPTASTHPRTRAMAAEPNTTTLKPQTEEIVPDATESMTSTSAPATRTNPPRGRRKRPKEEPESNKKPRWLFD